MKGQSLKHGLVVLKTNEVVHLNRCISHWLDVMPLKWQESWE